MPTSRDDATPDDDLDTHPPGPADHGGHGGMATRETDPSANHSRADDDDDRD